MTGRHSRGEDYARVLCTARAMGCHSVDGTYITFGPDTNLPHLLSWLDRAAEAPMLWEADRG